MPSRFNGPAKIITPQKPAKANARVVSHSTEPEPSREPRIVLNHNGLPARPKVIIASPQEFSEALSRHARVLLAKLGKGKRAEKLAVVAESLARTRVQHHAARDPERKQKLYQAIEQLEALRRKIAAEKPELSPVERAERERVYNDEADLRRKANNGRRVKRPDQYS